MIDIQVVQGGGVTWPILRLPSGHALCGNDPEDGGHLEDLRTGAVIPSDGEDFLLTVRISDQQPPNRPLTALRALERSGSRSLDA
ncbi:hypothetical protein NUM3379_36110 [Kineococcus sp. NUM-3379]